MRGEFVLELHNPGVTTPSTDRRRFSLRPDGHSSSQDRKARRQRAAPYPPQTPAPAVNSPGLPNQGSAEAMLRDAQSPERSTGPPGATRTNANPRFVNRNVLSGSGTVYTLLPYIAPSQDSHGPLVDVEDLRPELPDHRTPNPIINVELHEDPPSHSMDSGVQEVITAGVKPPTLREDVSIAADDSGVAALAKKILEYYKEAGVNLGAGSGTSEGRNLPSQNEGERVGPGRLYENLQVARATRAFCSSSSRGETVWWSSSSETPIDCPPSKVEPELGDLYIHRTLDGNSTKIWLAYKPLEWTELRVEYMETYLPDRIIKDARHPTFNQRLLKIWKNGEPSWVTQTSCSTLRARNKE